MKYLHISDPETSVHIILNELNKFSIISGYKLNFHKSELFSKNSLVNNLVHSLYLLDGQLMYLSI